MPDLELEKSLDRIKHIPFSGPELDDVFYVFALRVTNKDSIGKRKLGANKFYYLLDGFTVCEDKIIVSKERYEKTIYDYYVNNGHSKSPKISISAIVGENGAGKSSLLEFELRLINNFSAVIFGEYAKDTGWPHLHFIDSVYGELYYVLNNNAYCLSCNDREVNLYCYDRQEADENDNVVFQKSNSLYGIIPGDSIFQKDTPIKELYRSSSFESLKTLLSRFFYTVVLNQSAYAYNTKDFKAECNSEKYEIAARRQEKINNRGKRIPYSTEEKCWLNGLFHKNDGYQIPIVLTPYRFEGNYDVNVENKLAFERLISIMVRADESERIINGHLKVVAFALTHKDNKCDIDTLHEKLGYSQLSANDYEKMKTILLKCWQSNLGGKIPQHRLYRLQAVSYMVYKTLKIANTYNEYRWFRYKYNIKYEKLKEEDFEKLVEQTLANNSHVTSKLFRTYAYLIWGIYDKHEGDDTSVNFMLDDIGKLWMEVFNGKQGELKNSIPSTLLLEAAIPPPFFSVAIKLADLNTKAHVPFEYLSSGEKQQAFTISSLVYYLKNLDSVSKDKSTNERIAYKNVQLILEEVELYYHPELQRQFVRYLLDVIRHANLINIEWINICIVTHSPFVLSDIPACNVLALRKDGCVEKIPSFAANIHEMLKMSFFLKNGSIGDFASWTIMRIAKCLRIARWINGMEPVPNFFGALDRIPEEYEFLEEFELITTNKNFSKEEFNYVYPPDVLLAQINMIEEPIIRRALLDDFRRTYHDRETDYKKSMRALLQSQLAALDD